MTARLARVFALLSLFSLSAPATSQAELITTLSVEVEVTTGGLYRYGYTLENDADSDGSVIGFFLPVGVEADLQQTTGPASWDVLYAAGDTSIAWLAPLDGSGDVGPGQSASFSFLGLLSPGDQEYTLFTFETDSAGDPLIGAVSGTIAAPSGPVPAVPEPSALTLLGTGLLGLLGHAWRQRIIAQVSKDE